MGAVAGTAGCKCQGFKREADDDEGAPRVRADTRDSLQSIATENESSRPTTEKVFQISIQKGDVETVKSLLLQRACIKSSDKHGRTALHLAAGSGQLELGRIFVKKGAKKEAVDEYGRTPLLIAAEKGHVEFAQFLLGQGAARAPLDKRLVEAARGGKTELSKDLLLCGAKIGCKDKFGHTPLHKAASHGHLEMTRSLLESLANAATKSKRGSSAICGAAKNGHFDVIRLLVDNGANVPSEAKESLGKTLIDAAEKNDFALTKQLLIYNASIQAKDKNGRTPLIVAAEKGHFEIGSILVNALYCHGGITRGQKSALGKLLLSAADNCDTHRVKSLLDIHANLESRDAFDESALWKAAIKGHMDVAKILVDRKAELEAKSRNCCRTPLGIAIDKGHLDMSRFLLDRGASLPDVALLGKKLRESSEKGNSERVQTLLSCRVYVDAAVSRGSETPLHCAAANGHLEIAKLLVAGRADMGSRCGNPARTPLYYAASAGSVETFQFLVELAGSRNVDDPDGFEEARKLLSCSKYG